MNVQVLGSLWAAPLAWVWTHTVGLTGLVLASRAYYVVLVFVVGYLCYRALRPSFSPLIAAVGVAAPLLAPPYNIFSVSYNTSAMLALLVAVCGAFAAIRDHNRGWAFGSGVALAVASISYPPITLGALAVLVTVWLLARDDRRLVAWVVAGGALVAVPFVAWLAFGVGWKPISDTLAFTHEYMAKRSQPGRKTRDLASTYSLALFGPAMLPVVGLTALTTLRRFTARTRAVALALLPLAAVLPAAIHLISGGSYRFYGVLGSAYLLVVSVWMLVPVLVWLSRGSHAPAVTQLLVLSAPLAVVGGIAVASATSSNIWWGMPIVAAAPLATSVVLAWGTLVAEERRSVLPWAAAALVGVLVVLLTITPFRNPWPWKLTHRIEHGAFAGVRADPQHGLQVDKVTAAVERWVPEHGKVLFMGLPGGYLLSDATADTNVEWLGEFGSANRWVLDWLSERGGAPDTVFIAGDYPAQARGFQNLRKQDPLVDYVMREYHPAAHVASMDVFVRNR